MSFNVCSTEQYSYPRFEDSFVGVVTHPVRKSVVHIVLQLLLRST